MSLDWLLLGLRLVGTLILYTFLGVAFYIIWRELKQAAEQPVAITPATDQLRVVAVEDNQTLVVGQTLPLQPLTLLGRDINNQLAISYDENLPYHAARLRHDNGVWWLENTAAPNGAKLNQAVLSEPTPVSHGDLIEVDDVRFRLEIKSPV